MKQWSWFCDCKHRTVESADPTLQPVCSNITQSKDEEFWSFKVPATASLQELIEMMIDYDLENL